MAPSKPNARSILRGLRIGLTILVLGCVAVLAARHIYLARDPSEGELGAVTGTPDIGGHFTLVTHKGEQVSDADFLGRYLLIYFGYTYCPDICPTSLQRNIEALDLLGPDATRIVPVLISIDPERDTPERLAEYVDFFDARLVGLTGTPKQVAEAADSYRVFYARAATKDGDGNGDDYLVDHSSFTYLIGPNGKFIDFFRHATTSEEMALRLREQVRRE